MNYVLSFALRTSRRVSTLPPYPAYEGMRDVKLASLGRGKSGVEGSIPFTCQNSIPRIMSQFLGSLFKANPRLSVRADDPSLPFSITINGYDYRTRRSMAEEDIVTPERLQRVMGGYAELVSPIVSPYFVRHIIDEFRHVEKSMTAIGGPPRWAVIQRLEVIRQAADEGVVLNTNLRETWGVGKPLGYGMFRNEPLWQTTPDKYRDDTGYFKGKGYQPANWEEMCAVFPPRSIRRTKVRGGKV